MQNLAPIVLFVYNRLWHTQQTLEALQNNDLAGESDLYIYADGAQTVRDFGVEEVRAYIKTIGGFKSVTIIEREKNWGLADNIIDGVTDVVSKHAKIIVVEDDIVTSRGFLRYMNNALELYKDEKKVMHISAFVPVTSGSNRLPQTYFLRFMSCWGWATWQRSWEKLTLDIEYLYHKLGHSEDFSAYNLEGVVNMFSQVEQNMSGNLKTWAIKWYSTIFLEKGLCLYPKQSLVAQIGIDGTGTHCGFDNGLYKVDLADEIRLNKIKVRESRMGKNYLKRFYKYGRASSLKYRFRFWVIKKIHITIRFIKKTLHK